MSRWLRKLAKWFIVSSLPLALVATIVLGYWLKWDWTGLKGKTLWDWLNLLGVLAIPAAVGFGTIWFTAQQGKVSNIEHIDNQREAALQAYINAMSELLLDKELHKSQPDDEAQDVARIRTLTVLRRLDGERKGNVLRFLQEADLINKARPVVDLSEADLSYAVLSGAGLYGANLRNVSLSRASLVSTRLSSADLSYANLSSADLSYAVLSGANLNHANLSSADLNQADLSSVDFSHTDLSHTDFSGAGLYGANFKSANLRSANLRGAVVTEEQLEQAKSLQGAILRDGSKHP
jgi:uncharacterized protein YjbI with pentapeptide repeats